jgi:putative membrane protein
LRGETACARNDAIHAAEETVIGNALTGLVALIHVYIVYLEMALWDTPTGHRTFNLTPEFARASRVLAANQGLYNGFLAAGLAWGLYLGATGFAVKTFFLLCVLVAGVYGAATVGRKILYVQAIPAALALAAVWIGW